LDFNNDLVDLGASISIMPFSMFKRLGIGKLELINMVIEMADDTQCIPKGIVKNLVIKIDKFILPIDFVILDMTEDFKMPVILGRSLLATAHAKIDIFRKTISLKVGNETVIFKMRSNFSYNIYESVQIIKTNMNTKEDELMKIDSDLFTYNTDASDINHLLSIDPDVFTYDIEVQESYEEIVYRCSLIAQEANGGLSENDGKRIDVEWEDLSLNDWLRIRFGEVSKTTRDKILKDHWRKRFGNEYDDSEDFKDPDGCGKNLLIQMTKNTRKQSADC
ncbi:zinc knuckle CX2CX4HX4C containing protein, partial [Tanacetum coccineum]